MTAEAFGIVLVGGGSVRMGEPKALVPVGGRRCIEHVVDALRAVTGSMVLAGAADGLEFLGLRAVPDARTGAGPLAGLESGLAASQSETNLVVACDMPCVTPAFLRHLLDGLEGHDAVIPSTGSSLHPLCAAYSRRCLTAARSCLDGGSLKMMDFVAGLRHRVAPVEGAGFDPSVLLNMNSPADVDAAERALAGRPRGHREPPPRDRT